MMKKKTIFSIMLSIGSLVLISGSAVVLSRTLSVKQNNKIKERNDFYNEKIKELNSKIETFDSVFHKIKNDKIKEVSLDTKLSNDNTQNISTRWQKLKKLFETVLLNIQTTESQREDIRILTNYLNSFKTYFDENVLDFENNKVSKNNQSEKDFIKGELEEKLNFDKIEDFSKKVLLAQERGRLSIIGDNILKEIWKELKEDSLKFNLDKRVINLKNAFNNETNLKDLIIIINQSGALEELMNEEMLWGENVSLLKEKVNNFKTDLENLKNQWKDYNYQNFSQDTEMVNTKLKEIEKLRDDILSKNNEIKFIEREQNYFNYINTTLDESMEILNNWEQEYNKVKADDKNYFKTIEKSIDEISENLYGILGIIKK